MEWEDSFVIKCNMFQNINVTPQQQTQLNSTDSTETEPFLQSNTAATDTSKNKWRERAHRLDGCSCLLSLVCLGLTIGFWVAKTDNQPYVELSREMLLYSQKPNVTAAMRIFQSTYNDYCDKHSMRQYRPDWFDDAASFKGTSMYINVYASDLYLFPLAFFVYLFSAAFQFWRYRFRDWYHPEKPEFSRWLEYFCTAPLQIMIVSLSFGFASLDTIVCHAVLQAALVLFGYDLERQIKKIYRKSTKDDPKHVQQQKMNFQYAFVPKTDIRTWVYLFISWVIHFSIWGLPGAIPLGIGGKYQMQKDHNNDCEQNKDFKIPDFVDLIFWGQFLLFTAFGLVCTCQYFGAIFMIYDKTLTKEDVKGKWYWYTFCYALLSITAKTLLEVGIFGFVIMYKPWKQVADVNVTAGECPMLPPITLK